MPNQPDKFDVFLQQLAPLMRSRKFPSLKKSPPLYESLEFACVAAKQGNEWVLISGKAVLSIEPCAAEAQIVPVVQLQEIVALQGRIPAKRVKNLVADLRDFWVVRDLEGISVRLRAKGAGDYNWWLPHLIKWENPSNLCSRALALDGNDPEPSSRPRISTMRKIDSQLHSSRSAFNGFDGLCRSLGLPARLSDLTLSFHVSAELPAQVRSVKFNHSKRVLDIAFDCLGTPDLTVEWWPRLVQERIPATSWRRGPLNGAYRVSLRVLKDADAVDLILWFGKREADVSTVDLSPLYTGAHLPGEPISFQVVHQVPKDDEDIAEHRKNQELVKGEVASAGAQKLPKTTPAVAARRAVVRANATLTAFQICEVLDDKEIELPPGEEWDAFRECVDPWATAYRQGGEKLRRRIRVIISKDKSA
jgi:hypothetical protein